MRPFNQLFWGSICASFLGACDSSPTKLTSTEVESEFSIAGDVILQGPRGAKTIKVLNAQLDSIDTFKTNWYGEFNHTIVSAEFNPKVEPILLEVIGENLSLIVPPSKQDTSKNHIVSSYSSYLVEKALQDSDTLSVDNIDSLKTKLYTRVFSESFQYNLLMKSQYQNIVTALEVSLMKTAGDLDIDIPTLLNQSISILDNHFFLKNLAEYIFYHPQDITPYDLKRLDENDDWVDVIVDKISKIRD